MEDNAWGSLLNRVRENRHQLLEDFLAQLSRQPDYVDASVSRDELERTALQVFDLFLNRLADPQGGSGSGSSDVATQLGRRRARQGVSFEQFTEAVRINFRLFWRALHRVAQPDLVEALTAHGEEVLNVVEGYATEVQRAFLEESQVMAQQHRTARERSLARVFSGLRHHCR